MSGLGKARTKLGKWLDHRGVAQQWLADKTGLNKATISDLTTKKDRIPTGRTMKRILDALRKIDPNVKQDDFWKM